MPLSEKEDPPFPARNMLKQNIGESEIRAAFYLSVINKNQNVGSGENILMSIY